MKIRTPAIIAKSSPAANHKHPLRRLKLALSPLELPLQSAAPYLALATCLRNGCPRAPLRRSTTCGPRRIRGCWLVLLHMSRVVSALLRQASDWHGVPAPPWHPFRGTRVRLAGGEMRCAGVRRCRRKPQASRSCILAADERGQGVGPGCTTFCEAVGPEARCPPCSLETARRGENTRSASRSYKSVTNAGLPQSQGRVAWRQAQLGDGGEVEFRPCARAGRQPGLAAPAKRSSKVDDDDAHLVACTAQTSCQHARIVFEEQESICLQGKTAQAALAP